VCAGRTRTFLNVVKTNKLKNQQSKGQFSGSKNYLRQLISEAGNQVLACF